MLMPAAVLAHSTCSTHTCTARTRHLRLQHLVSQRYQDVQSPCAATVPSRKCQRSTRCVALQHGRAKHEIRAAPHASKHQQQTSPAAAAAAHSPTGNKGLNKQLLAAATAVTSQPNAPCPKLSHAQHLHAHLAECRWRLYAHSCTFNKA
jgi:hypothetical protein